MYLQSSQVVVSKLYLGVPMKADITLINGTLLPTRFHWGKVSEPPALEAPGEGGTAPQAPPEQILSLPSTAHPLSTGPRKAGPLKGVAHLVWLFLDLPSRKASSLPEESQVHRARPPGPCWSTQLLGAPMRHCPRAAGARSACQGTWATFLCLRGSCLCSPSPWFQGSSFSPGHPWQGHLGGKEKRGDLGSSPPVSTRPSRPAVAPCLHLQQSC